MKIYLTNLGHRYISNLLKSKDKELLLKDDSTNLLLSVLEQIVIDTKKSVITDELYNKGFIQTNSDNLTEQDIKLLYKRNPIENIDSVVFEYTTACNFNCMHCRIVKKNSVTETNVDKLKEAADLFIDLGIKKFVFIGGEVSKFGDGWLDLARHINIDRGFKVGILTNGWWLDELQFNAAGKNYTDDLSYLEDLKQNGVTHIIFSIDGREEHHDTWRRQLGLYSRIIEGLKKVKQVGLKPGISVVIKNNIDQDFLKSLAEIAEIIYSLPKNTPEKNKFMRLSIDQSNIFSNFIDIGNGINLRDAKNKISDIPLKDLRCKAFYRPWPNIRINANGELSVCPLLNAGEGYGNIHNLKLRDILNNMQNTLVYKLHSERLINNYLKYWDTTLFGNSYEHLCSVRATLIILAKKMHHNGFDLSTPANKIGHLLKETAEECGFTS